MDTVFIILGILIVVVGFFLALADILEWPKRRRIILAGLSGVVGLGTVGFGFWPTDKPATPADVDTIISSKVDSLGNELSCKIDNLSALIISMSGQKEPDSSILALARERAECLDGIVKTALDKGIVAIGLGKYDEALTHLGYALTAVGENLNQRSDVFFYMGLIRSHQGEYTFALDCYDSSVTYDPTSHDSWYNRGNALGELDRYDEAIASYDSALVYKPDYHDAWNNRGCALDELKRYDEAIASYDSALVYKPDLDDAWSNRGKVLFELDRYEEAVTSCDSALAYKPDDHEAWQNRAVTLARLNRFEEALSSCDSSLKYDPGDSSTVELRQLIMELMNE